MDKDIEEEFQEMKERFEDFLSHLIFKQPRKIKENVFHRIVNEKRTKERLVNMARGTRPFLAEEVWDLLDEYMDFLRNLPGDEGDNYKVVYENFAKADLVKRLLFKRPLAFLSHDLILMRYNGTSMEFSENECFKIATILDQTSEAVPYLKEYISYDENLLSSLIGMSTPTYYFNIGSGKSKNEIKKPHIDEGILCGLVGARNSKPGFMEHRFVFPRSEATNNECHKSDDFWIKKVYSEAFPEGIIPTVKDLKNKPDVYDSIYINGINEVYLEKRLMLSILPYIKEAAARGIEQEKNIFCSVPPIGGGCWKGRIDALTINRLIVSGVLKYLDAEFDYELLKFKRALVLPPLDVDIYESFVPKNNINDIEINQHDCKITITLNEPSSHKITIFNKLRYVAELLPEEFKDCISIAGYAWDGNSYPGNEYWIGGLKSFDPQAIYCSLLGQFQNPEVNVKMADPERIRVY